MQDDYQKIDWEDPKPRRTMLIKGKPIYEIGNFISQETAENYHLKFLEEPTFKDSKNGKIYKASLFGKGNLLKLLMQPDCHGIRIYYGKDDTGKPAPIIVGVYCNGNNMTDHTLRANGSFPCPDVCHGDDDQDGNYGEFGGS
jgi:hypothetical protein